MLTNVSRAKKNGEVPSDGGLFEAETVQEVRRMSARPFPSINFPLAEIREAFPNLSKRDLDDLRKQWAGKFSSKVSPRTTWLERRKRYSEAVREVAVSCCVGEDGTGDEKAEKLFEKRVERMVAALHKPDRKALAKLYRTNREPSDVAFRDFFIKR